uniref:Uncharacterized protein n=1 Tax=Siphoviridae sp. ct7aK2 TaxID=2825351 RepID=A0A8S5U9A1_9CAUD|nr:MAG TPA: hypothetical protein [Siphoviridae sp. ct7aK2]
MLKTKYVSSQKLQPVRNSLTDWNGQGGQNPPAIPMTIPRNYVLENPY